MVLQTACSLALFCQRCGKIHIVDVPYFTGTQKTLIRCDSCHHGQALILRENAGWLELNLPCAICGHRNTMKWPIQSLSHIDMDKIYCERDHFELGYIGRHDRIKEMLDFNRAEFEALHPGGQHLIDQQRILLEAVNRVLDLAEAGDIVCPCGSHAVSAAIRGSNIELMCLCCGSYAVIKAETAADLERISAGCISFAYPDAL